MMKTEIYIWSAIGNTPITKRKGAYCDVLFHGEIETSGPNEARQKVIELIKNTPYADKGHFSIPSHPNQNIRNSFVSMN